MNTMEQFTCDDISAVLSGLLDGELDERRQHVADVHLAKCERCRTMVNEAEELDAEVRASVSAREEACWSDELERRILLSINDPVTEWRSQRRLRISAWSGWATAIAALIMVAFLLVFENGGSNSGGSAEDINRLASSNTNTNANSGAHRDVQAKGVNEGASSEAVAANRSVVEDEGDDSVVSSDEKLIDENRFALNDDANANDNSEEGSVKGDADAGASDAVTVNDSGFTAIDLLGDYSSISSRLAVFVPDERSASAPLFEGNEESASETDREAESAIDSSRVASGGMVGDDEGGGGGEGVEVAGNAELNDGNVEGASDVALRLASVDGPADEGDDEVVSSEDDWRYGTDDVLFNAAVALHALADANVDSFSDVREINQALEYDDLLDKLAESREEMRSEDASIVDRAWAALEWVSGPVDQAQLVRVQEMIADENLVNRLETLSDEYGTY